MSTRQYDALGRSSSVVHRNVQNVTLASTASGTADYDAAGRRTKRTGEDGSYWQYGYDPRGEVTAGQRRLSGGTLLAGWQFGYGYDAIGNRTTAATGGDAAGGNLRVASYSADALNRYTARDIPGYVDLLGSSTADAAITVNGLAVDR